MILSISLFQTSLSDLLRVVWRLIPMRAIPFLGKGIISRKLWQSLLEHHLDRIIILAFLVLSFWNNCSQTSNWSDRQRKIWNTLPRSSNLHFEKTATPTEGSLLLTTIWQVNSALSIYHSLTTMLRPVKRKKKLSFLKTLRIIWPLHIPHTSNNVVASVTWPSFSTTWSVAQQYKIWMKYTGSSSVSGTASALPQSLIISMAWRQTKSCRSLLCIANPSPLL